jgi:drug/metabolite transporter (DMT)-like permease
MFGYHVLFFTALKYTTAINSSIIAATTPMVTTLLAFVFLRTGLGRKQIFGVLLSFAGVVLTITGADFDVLKQFEFNVGDLWMLAAVAAWAAYGVFSKSKGKESLLSCSPFTVFWYARFCWFPLFYGKDPGNSCPAFRVPPIWRCSI